jgi:hypothetical protein
MAVPSPGAKMDWINYLKELIIKDQREIFPPGLVSLSCQDFLQYVKIAKRAD